MASPSDTPESTAPDGLGDGTGPERVTEGLAILVGVAKALDAAAFAHAGPFGAVPLRGVYRLLRCIQGGH